MHDTRLPNAVDSINSCLGDVACANGTHSTKLPLHEKKNLIFFDASNGYRQKLRKGAAEHCDKGNRHAADFLSLFLFIQCFNVQHPAAVRPLYTSARLYIVLYTLPHSASSCCTALAPLPVVTCIPSACFRHFQDVRTGILSVNLRVTSLAVL